MVIDAQGQRAEGSFARTLTVSGPVDLDVQTGSGDIEVRIGQTGTVQVEARIRAWARDGADAAARVREVESDPPVEQSGDTVRLGVRRNDKWNWDLGGVSISYRVTVPARHPAADPNRLGGSASGGGPPRRGRFERTPATCASGPWAAAVRATAGLGRHHRGRQRRRRGGAERERRRDCERRRHRAAPASAPARAMSG